MSDTNRTAPDGNGPGETGETVPPTLTDFQQQALLLEYEKLKEESTARIIARDHLVYLNLAAVGLIASTATSSTNRTLLLLLIPLICTCFGWVYLMNDEKISGLSRYTRYHVAPRIGADAFGWENRFKRRTTLKWYHSWGQFFMDIIMFIGPTVGALTLYCLKSPPNLSIIVVILEAVMASFLFLMIWLHSPNTKIFDYTDNEWVTGRCDREPEKFGVFKQIWAAARTA